MITLGIETSCDETGIALYDGARNQLLGEQLHSQIDLHREFAGVVPELAARDHIQRLPLLLDKLLDQCQLSIADIAGIAYTRGPGLSQALRVGATFARALGKINAIPVIGVHHMEGHLLAPLLKNSDALAFPLVGLLVSGGHTQLIFAEAIGRYSLLGQTRDDAVGEAFDKTARLLGLPYPGGPELAKLATQGDDQRYPLPRPMPQGMEFSFSGLKTSVRTLVDRLGSALDAQARADICASFERTAVESLVHKCTTAMQHTQCNRLLVAGGVSANTRLRAELKKLPAELLLPDTRYCTDNGAMIALVGALRLRQGQSDNNDSELPIMPRWPLEELSPI